MFIRLYFAVCHFGIWTFQSFVISNFGFCELLKSFLINVISTFGQFNPVISTCGLFGHSLIQLQIFRPMSLLTGVINPVSFQLFDFGHFSNCQFRPLNISYQCQCDLRKFRSMLIRPIGLFGFMSFQPKEFSVLCLFGV